MNTLRNLNSEEAISRELYGDMHGLYDIVGLLFDAEDFKAVYGHHPRTVTEWRNFLGELHEAMGKLLDMYNPKVRDELLNIVANNQKEV